MLQDVQQRVLQGMLQVAKVMLLATSGIQHLILSRLSD